MRMEMYPKNEIDMSVEFCGVKFIHPFILAAAPPSDDLDMVKDAFSAGWAGAVLKTTSIPGTDVPLAYPMMSGVNYGTKRLMGMGNIDLISEHHIDVVERRTAILKSEFSDRRVIISISGGDKNSWQDVAERSRKAGADLIECSFSCPQGSLGLKPGLMLGQDVEASKRVAGWIKEAAKDTPVIIKLTPQVSDIAEVAEAVRSSGVDAVCVGNTIPSLMGVNIDDGVPIPNVAGKSTYSGLSGPAVKPISLRCISIVAKDTGIPIAGSGGAITWRDAIEFISLGAGIVEFCTAVMHYGIDIIDDLLEGTALFMERKGLANLDAIRGSALKNIVSHDELSRLEKWRPHIREDECVRCDACAIACRDGGHRAIKASEERLPIVDDERCVGCGLCSTMCPVNCIDMKPADL